MGTSSKRYNLQEISAKVGLPSLWINKIKKVLSLEGERGKRGKRSSYNMFDLKLFQRVAILRAANFILEEIISLLEDEKKIKQYVGKHFCFTSIHSLNSSPGQAVTIDLFLDPYRVYFIDKRKFKGKKRKHFFVLWNVYSKNLRIIAKRISCLSGLLKESKFSLQKVLTQKRKIS
jgi:hypothetical protein